LFQGLLSGLFETPERVRRSLCTESAISTKQDLRKSRNMLMIEFACDADSECGKIGMKEFGANVI
jgi:hypothetical protein